MNDVEQRVIDFVKQLKKEGHVCGIFIKTPDGQTMTTCCGKFPDLTMGVMELAHAIIEETDEKQNQKRQMLS